MTVFGILKSGKMILRCTSDRGDPIKLLGKWYEKFDLVTRKFIFDGTAQCVRNETLFERSVRRDINAQEEERHQQLFIGNDESELEVSVESRSFVIRVNDQVRRRHTNFKCFRRWRKTFYDLVNVHDCNRLNQQYSWERTTWTIVIPSRIQKISHWNKCSICLQDWCLNKMRSQDWKQLVGREFFMEILVIDWWLKSYQSSTHEGLRLFGFCVVLWEDTREHSIKHCMGTKIDAPEYITLDRIDGEPMEVEWNTFPWFTTLQLSQVVQELLLRLNETPENFKGRIIFMSMFNDISWGERDNEKEWVKCSTSFSQHVMRLGTGQWSFIDPGSEKKWYSIKEDSPQGICDKIAERMLVGFAESGCPKFPRYEPIVQRSTQKHRTWKTIDTLCGRFGNCWDFFTYLSLQTSSLYGAVAEICEGYESFHERTERPVVMGQSSSSLVLSAINTEVLLDTDDPAYQNFLLCNNMENEIEKLSRQDKRSKFCMEAGFMRVVENGQYFMTKDTGDFWQFQSVACREYTLPRGDQASQPKWWIQGNMRIGPLLEVTTSFKTSNMELKFELSLWIKTILILGSELLMEQSNIWSIQFKTSQKCFWMMIIMLTKRYGERTEKLSQQDRLSKFCFHAGVLTTVEVGQYISWRKTLEISHNFIQWLVVNTLFQLKDEASQPKGWIQGNTQFGPVLEVATCCLHGKDGVDIIIWSLNRDDIHSWVRISHGSNKFVMNMNHNETEIP